MPHSIFSLKTDNQVLLQKYHKVRRQSAVLCEPLEKEDFVVQPVVDVSPPKWHLAHTTWFFETFVLVPHLKGYQLFDKNYPYLFNSYYVSAGDRWTRADRGNLTRPTVDEIFAYREYVDKHIVQFLDQGSVDNELAYVFEVGLNHEQQHQELLMYDLKYILGHNPLFPAYKESASYPQVPAHSEDWLSIAEGIYEIGNRGEEYCFDNELGKHQVYLHAFEIGAHPVTNGEYLEFMQDGGYESHQFWLSEGWDWANQLNTKAPMYWINEDGHWYQYQLGGLRKLDLNQPVSHVSFYEADAFAAWKGVRLPSEQEWEVAVSKYETSIPQEANFLEDAYLQPIRNEGYGFYGNLWEWTSSPYRPYPFFRPANGTLGEYNGKFMINTMVLRGGSYATPRSHIRLTYRNFFHPQLQWLFSGIRLARFN